MSAEHWFTTSADLLISYELFYSSVTAKHSLCHASCRFGSRTLGMRLLLSKDSYFCHLLSASTTSQQLPLITANAAAGNVQHGRQGWQRTPDQSAWTPHLSRLLFLWLCELEGGWGRWWTAGWLQRTSSKIFQKQPRNWKPRNRNA